MRPSTIYSTAAIAAAGLGMVGLVAGQTAATTITSDSLVPVTTIVETTPTPTPAVATSIVVTTTTTSSSSSSETTTTVTSFVGSPTSTSSVTSTSTTVSTAGAGPGVGVVDGCGAVAAGWAVLCAMGMAVM